MHIPHARTVNLEVEGEAVVAVSQTSHQSGSWRVVKEEQDTGLDVSPKRKQHRWCRKNLGGDLKGGRFLNLMLYFFNDNALVFSLYKNFIFTTEAE